MLLQARQTVVCSFTSDLQLGSNCSVTKGQNIVHEKLIQVAEINNDPGDHHTSVLSQTKHHLTTSHAEYFYLNVGFLSHHSGLLSI